MAMLGKIARSSTRMRNSHPFSVMVSIVGGEPSQSHLCVVRKALFVEGTIQAYLSAERGMTGLSAGRVML